MREQISILDGNTFLVCDRQGDVTLSYDFPTGLFAFDTRFLSTWQLTVNGARLHALSVDDSQPYETRYFLVPGEPTHYLDAQLSVIRYRAIGGELREELTVLNHSPDEAEVNLRLDIGSDFADLFEIKHIRDKKSRPIAAVGENELQISYRRDRFHRQVTVRSSQEAMVDEQGMRYLLRLPPHSEWSTELTVTTSVLASGGIDFRTKLPIGRQRPSSEIRAEHHELLRAAPQLSCDYEPLSVAYHTSLRDLAALRYESISLNVRVVAAGLPWFMTLFGRDSLITCLQALPFLPDLAPPILGILGGLQGCRLDDFRDEEPGKILHELRYGESAAFEEQPHTPYYGAADSTALFVILLDEYERWTGNSSLVRLLEHPLRAALDWLDSYGNLLGNGYVSYQTRNPETGLQNQCWKDSWDGIPYADGRLPRFPRATCELQGYAYDAKLRGARLFRTFFGEPVYAERLEREAADLKARFNRDFWVADGGYYALALDGESRQVDALASNMGHLLWSGIVEESRAAQVAEHLLGPRLFSGWGVRTLATGQARYNPVGYHVGTVWPFDNTLIAWGLWRYGFRQEAGRICQAVIEASEYFDGRLPEAFAGYERSRTLYPVEYPTACSPQAWSAGAPLLALRVMLGLEPQGEHLIIDPAVPAGMGRIELLDIPGRWGHVDALGRDRDHPMSS